MEMISKYLIPLLLTLICLPAYAQMEIGIKGGPTLSWIHTTGRIPDDFQIDQKTKVGFFLGATTDIAIGGKWYFSPELYYVQRGNRSEGQGISLGYLSLPLNVSYFPHPSFGIQAGAGISYLISYKIGGYRIPDGGETFDFGIQGGLIYQLSDEFSLTARYYNGFSSYNTLFFTDQDGNLVDEIKNLNRSVEIGGVFYIEWR